MLDLCAGISGGYIGGITGYIRVHHFLPTLCTIRYPSPLAAHVGRILKLVRSGLAEGGFSLILFLASRPPGRLWTPAGPRNRCGMVPGLAWDSAGRPERLRVGPVANPPPHHSREAI